MSLKTSKQLGFSIIEVSVVMIIMSIMATSAFTIIEHLSRQLVIAEDKMSLLSFKKEVDEFLNQAPICTRSLAGIVLPAIGGPNVSNIKLKYTNGTDLYNTTTNKNFDFLTILNIELKNIDIPNTATRGAVELLFELQKNRSKYGEIIPYQKKVTVNVDLLTRAITSCGTASEQIWQDLTSIRVDGVTYKNDTGSPITVSLALRDGGTLNVSPDGLTWLPVASQGYRPGYTQSAIPNEWFYRVSGRRNGRWLELR